MEIGAVVSAHVACEGLGVYVRHALALLVGHQEEHPACKK